MSILQININNIFDIYKQNFDVSEENKKKYGEVRTDYSLINKMLNLMPQHLFENPELKWFDPCCGNGYFMIVLFHRLYIFLKTKINNSKLRKLHIIKNMLFMNEINSEHIPILKNIFGDHANIYNYNYFEMTNIKIDIIVANPPFNYGVIKTPTNNNISKKLDGKCVWQKFIRQFIHQLDDYQHLLTIIPSLWMKKYHSFNSFLTQFEILKLHTMNNTETNRIFHTQAQTPTCYFHLQKKPTSEFINLYDQYYNKYIHFPIDINLPVHCSSIIKKMLPFIDIYGSIDILKTNLDTGIRSKKTVISDVKTNFFAYTNIKTCYFKKNTMLLNLVYTNKPCNFYDIKKLIFANKMYGLPQYDITGKYGITTKDNYVIINKTHEQFLKIQKLFYTKTIIYILESTRYRMKNLDISAFYYIPNIIDTIDYKNINDKFLFKFFKFDSNQINIINNYYNSTEVPESLP